jgi:signal transduction histidine kinase
MFAKLASVMPAVPDKFVLVSPVIDVTAVLTNAVVANCVVLVNAGAVIEVGVPVKEGEAMFALNKISAVLVVILAVMEVIFVFKVVKLELILAVFDVTFVFNVLIEFKLAVKLAMFEVILLVSVVSAAVALVVSAVIEATFEIILLDKLAVSAFCNK